MKKLIISKWLIVLFCFVSFVTLSQDNKIKIYESKSGDGRSLIIFPNSPEPLMVITGNDDCKIAKTMAQDEWQEMSAKTVVTTCVVEPVAAAKYSVKSPRDVASGQATGKRQHKPINLGGLSLDALDEDSDGDGIEVYSFSWGMSNSGGASIRESPTVIRESPTKVTYDIKTNTKRTASASSVGSCCSNGVCTITVSVDKKHTKSGHVTLLK
jgi:hypothetical protein